ncbi:hypothetical protein ACWDTI_13050 [Gordonia sp. NPDC003424]
MISQLSPRLQEEFKALGDHRDRIEAALHDTAFSDRFIADPRAALAELKIEVPPILAHQLKRSKGLADLAKVRQPITFLLPNGQLLTTTPRIRITGLTDRGTVN